MDQKKLVVREASAMIRGFVWGIPSSIDDDNSPHQFTDGEPACAIELLMLFFNNMSVEFKARIGGFKDNVSRIHLCSENHEHNYISDTRFVDLLDIDDLMRDFLLDTQECSSEEEQEKEFCSVLLHHLVVREKKFPCTYETDCKGMVTATNEIIDSHTPPFLFITDPTNFVRRHESFSSNSENANINHSNIYFPENISLTKNSQYQLHGRVYSTSSTGEHFFTVCYKIIDAVTDLYLKSINSQSLEMLIRST
ncbi:uncharacterized protein EV154DRAFT_604503 [Mucor mucedo]|uniref:uncharacterized protein n=1 Tax=Mucor mucedo TaxID=29922 RepID=UPI00221E8762|nr:uncharacterized protein EV154DRAFT_604503 [Mucor mucedo]KAI7888789.1 hypothetical protein EV154DRAFT_604503 [Mucor mucedo]